MPPQAESIASSRDNDALSLTLFHYLSSAFFVALLVQTIIVGRISALVRPARPQPLPFRWLLLFRLPLISALVYVTHALWEQIQEDHVHWFGGNPISIRDHIHATETAVEDRLQRRNCALVYFYTVCAVYAVEALVFRLQNGGGALGAGGGNVGGTGTMGARNAERRIDATRRTQEATLGREGVAGVDVVAPTYIPSLLPPLHEQAWDIAFLSWILFHYASGGDMLVITFMSSLQHISLQLLGLWPRRGPMYRLVPSFAFGLLHSWHFLTCWWGRFNGDVARHSLGGSIVIRPLSFWMSSGSTYPLLVSMNRLLELLLLFSSVLGFTLYGIMAAVPGGSPPVPFDQIRRHLPTLADDYVIALIKLATAVAAMGKLSGFRNAREPIYAPRVSSYTAAADGSSPDASIAQAHPRSMTRYALRERRRTTGFAALVPAEDSLPARTQATTSPYLTIFQRLYSLLYRFWHGPLRHGGDIDQGKMEDARVVISPSDSDDDDDGDWMPMDDTSASDSTDDEEEETSSMPVDRGELFEELYYLRRDQDEASDAVCSTSPIHHRQRPLSLTTTAHSSTPHQPPSLSLDTALCIICATDPRNIILQPCRCLVLCDGCREEMAARAYTLCPTCRSPVVGYSRVFAV